MGSASNEMTPQPKSRMAMMTTRKRLLSAKSTRPRIIVRSLSFGVLQHQRVLNDALPGLNACPDLLHVAGQHFAAAHFDALELSVLDRHVNPVAVVEMQNRTRRHHRVDFRLLAVESGLDKHTQAHESRVLYFQADF